MVLALNLLGDRFWCRNACPLGALLGYLSKISLFKLVIGDSCKGCARCEHACRLGAIDANPQYEILVSECTLCLDCLVACRAGDIHFSVSRRIDPLRSYDPARREAIAALVSGFTVAALLQVGAWRRSIHPLHLRPPGVPDEAAFLARCLRCGVCMRVCPTSGLQPVLVDAAVEGLWTPVLTPRLGFCDYGCNACGQSCPSGAIPNLLLEDKRSAIIGAAYIDPERCLPWSQDVPCIVCEEMCPIPEKAVKLEDVLVTDFAGESIVLQRPTVLEHLCIGCGVCEFKCPVEGEAAIRVRRVA
jgi:MauM/NapG family ferredoxin protein